MQKKTPHEALQERLEAFVFFHLGSDAQTSIVAGEGRGFKVEIRHPRVHPIRFTLDDDNRRRFVRDEAAFEEFMLTELTSHRRGGLAG